MNILVLNGSPKAHSTTLDMTKAFLNGLCQTEPAHIQYISSYDKNVKYCQGDLSCWFRQDGQCIIQDDDLSPPLPRPPRLLKGHMGPNHRLFEN